MEIAKETRDRISLAADTLYEQSGRAVFPTVDAVRKLAKVNMNDASTGMKDWRRAQTAQAAPVAVQVPEVVQQASSAATVALWMAAQEHANESLRAAQAGWDAERIEAETLNRQMADAHEVQEAELEAARGEILEFRTTVDRMTTDGALLSAELAEVRGKLLAANAATGVAEARAVEIERRAAELRSELDAAHRAASVAHEDMAALRSLIDTLQGQAGDMRAKVEKANAERDDERKKSVEAAGRAKEQIEKANAERDDERRRAAAAREDTAKLHGQVEALQTQITGLVAAATAFRSTEAVTPSGAKKR